MDYTSLLNEITNDPLELGYALHLPANPGIVVSMLNDKIYSAPKTLMISERGVMAKYPGGALAADAILTKLEAFSLTGSPMASVIKRVLKFLAMPEGIDIGSAASQGMLGALAGANIITPEEATTLRALANQPTSRAEVLGYSIISEADLRSAGVI